MRPNGEHGKGVYAGMDFKEDELVLKDTMLFGIQHSSNKMDCFVCSHCFQFIGSVELQVGRKLFLQNLGKSENENSGQFPFSNGLKYGSGECSLSHDEEGSEEEGEEEDVEQDLEACSSSNSKRRSACMPTEVIESLMNNKLHLPYSNQFKLPGTVSCPGACEEAFYCSKFCAEADWDLSHSLICTGKASKSSSTEALMRFIQHANETNDIFLLAAKAISFTLLRYKKLKASYSRGKEKYDAARLSNDYFPLLLQAWEPIAMGYKGRWWDCISLPDDIPSCDESSFRLQIKELAFTSLQLLKEALFDQECEPLFSLEIYGHIIGMFELNNLDLVVESPVEDYFLYIDALQHSEKEKAEAITKPLLDALGEDYSCCCEGTAFYPLQSCINHSCSPNVKAFKREEDRDGQATLLSLKTIQKGEEITISYINEELTYEERQSLLADYGFTCKCQKCLIEKPS